MRAPIFDNNLRLDATILASYRLISRRRAISVKVIVRIGHVRNYEFTVNGIIPEDLK